MLGELLEAVGGFDEALGAVDRRVRCDRALDELAGRELRLAELDEHGDGVGDDCASGGVLG
jgi:hypothetical protein